MLKARCSRRAIAHIQKRSIAENPECVLISKADERCGENALEDRRRLGKKHLSVRTQRKA